MSQLKQLIQEVHRRSLWQVLGIYVVVSWVVFQVVQTLTEGLGLPDWVPPFAFVLLLIGLPIVMATAFVQEGIPVAGGSEELSSESESVADAVKDEAPAPRAEGVRRLFTWRKAILGGVLAFALLGVVTAGYMGMRLLGIGPVGSLVAAGVLEKRDRIILAEFENHTGDPQLGEAMTEAFRVTLAQSRVVTVADPEYVAQVLERMELPRDTRLDEDLAREAAVREGLKALIAGEIATAGRGYLLSARLVSAETGESLAVFRETVDDSSAVAIMRAVDKLSNRMRGRIGESLKTIRAGQSLDQVTTASLDALRKYSQAVRAIGVESDLEKGTALLEEAVALDPEFAMAWRKLGTHLMNLGGEPSRSVAALTKAYEHSDRLTDRERYLTLSVYYRDVTGELGKSITALRTLLDSYPDDAWALVHLGLRLESLGEPAQAEDLYERAIEINPYSLFGWWNAIGAQTAQGEFEKAETTLVAFSENMPGNLAVRWLDGLLGAAQGEYDRAAAEVNAVRAEQPGSSTARRLTSEMLAQIVGARGQLLEADRYLRDAMASAEADELASGYLSFALQLAGLELFFRGDADGALRRVEHALERYPLESLDPLDRPYAFMARVYALAARPERANELLTEYDREVGSRVGTNRRFERQWARGVVASAEGRHSEAIEILRRAMDSPRDCRLCALPDLARAYDRDEQLDSALAVYERYVTTPDVERLWVDYLNLHEAYARLGELHEERGHAGMAIYYYGKLVDLLKDADPELQPRVEAARRAISALSPDQ